MKNTLIYANPKDFDQENQTPLCEIAFKYGTDKCPQLGHSYTPFYYDLLKDKREKIRKVLEIGIGSAESLNQAVPSHYQKGASLLMWRDFFPNAHIYGVDIDPSTIFQAERITTFLLNTKYKSSLANLTNKIGTDIDLVIDDGDHNGSMQLRTTRILMPLLKKDCIYIIEDSKDPDNLAKWLDEYDCQAIRFSPHHKQDTLVVIKNK